MRLLLVGDVMLGRLVNQALEREPPGYPWGDTITHFERAHVRLCNLECAIADHGQPWTRTPKAFHFRSDAKNVAVLEAARIDLVSLANNHTLDYGEEALLETLGVLDRHGIGHAGAGADQRGAAHPALAASRDLRVALLAFTDNEPEWEATPGRPGTRFVPVDTEDERAKRLFASVSAAKARADVVVVAAHWGSNWGYRPEPAHVPFAHRLVEAGADIVFGHSCHVLRGIEVYRERPILYGAGDFVDDYAVDDVERNDHSCLFLVESDGRSMRRLRLIPTVIGACQARLARGPEAEQIAALMRVLCLELGTGATWRQAEGCLEIAI